MRGGFLESVGRSYARADGPDRAIVAVETDARGGNRLGALHGGFLAGFADHAFFAGLAAMGDPDQANAVTLDLTMQYLDAAAPGTTIEAHVERLHQTRRTIFMRMTIRAEGRPIAAATATVRKVKSAN